MIEALEIEEGEPLMLVPAPNGGWVVRSNDDYMKIGKVLGAFSNTADMLEALTQTLNPCRRPTPVCQAEPPAPGAADEEEKENYCGD